MKTIKYEDLLPAVTNCYRERAKITCCTSKSNARGGVRAT